VSDTKNCDSSIESSPWGDFPFAAFAAFAVFAVFGGVPGMRREKGSADSVSDSDEVLRTSAIVDAIHVVAGFFLFRKATLFAGILVALSE
jgi:hypothetical protein